MASINYDGQSILIDGRRIWLVSGAIHYPRVPRALWRDRIRAAKQAGLNCIETYVFWNMHEPRPGVFDFQDGLDLRAFVKAIGDEGMFCILRPGPYVCAEWDAGGLPAWLLKNPDVQPRSANPPFLEAAARYLGAVFGQVADLQATTTAGSIAVTGTKGGPVVMVQAENEYFCDNAEQSRNYLHEITRYLREAGCTVPINDCNNLWRHVEGTIACWNAREDLPAILRQLHVVQPNAPRIVMEYWPGRFDHWGAPHDRSITARRHYEILASILASGGQYNIHMFHGGTNFGFTAGRNAGERENFITTSYDYDAPLGEAGGRGDKYLATKRISVFASQFAHVLAGLQPQSQHATLLPQHDNQDVSVIHQRGAQGDLVFVFKGDGCRTSTTTLLTPDGVKLTVPLGDDPVAWLALRVNLAGAAELTSTNLRPWAFIDKQLLVLFGPPGSAGIVCINDARLDVTVPTGRKPNVQRHEGLTVAVLSTEQVDASYLAPVGLVVGAAGLDAENRPLPLTGWTTAIIRPGGEVEDVETAPTARTGSPPRLAEWRQAGLDDVLGGGATTFKQLDGPRSFESLGNSFGYGWYRITAGGSGKALFPIAGDRLHVYRGGKLQALLGDAPGADSRPTDLNLDDVTILADNLGRFCHAWRMGRPTGIASHAYAVRRVRLAKPKVIDADAPDLFTWRSFLYGVRKSHRPPSQALVWKISRPAKGNVLILDIDSLPGRCLITLNGNVIGGYDLHASAAFARFVLEPGAFKAGQNELRLTMVGPLDKSAKPATQMVLHEGVSLTAKAQWWFSPWKPPAADEFKPIDRSAGSNQPRWYRGVFSVKHAEAPLWLEPVGMSKGQIYLNGHNVGRYFVGESSGKAVPPQKRYYLPEPWLQTDKPNALLLFDEHGKHPGKCRLAYDANGPYGRTSRRPGSARG